MAGPPSAGTTSTRWARTEEPTRELAFGFCPEGAGRELGEDALACMARKRAEAESARQGFQKAFPADDPCWGEAQPSQEE
jgi:hypothetical protein